MGGVIMLLCKGENGVGPGVDVQVETLVLAPLQTPTERDFSLFTELFKAVSQHSLWVDYGTCNATERTSKWKKILLVPGIKCKCCLIAVSKVGVKHQFSVSLTACRLLQQTLSLVEEKVTHQMSRDKGMGFAERR